MRCYLFIKFLYHITSHTICIDLDRLANNSRCCISKPIETLPCYVYHLIGTESCCRSNHNFDVAFQAVGYTQIQLIRLQPHPLHFCLDLTACNYHDRVLFRYPSVFLRPSNNYMNKINRYLWNSMILPEYADMVGIWSAQDRQNYQFAQTITTH